MHSTYHHLFLVQLRQGEADRAAALQAQLEVQRKLHEEGVRGILTKNNELREVDMRAERQRAETAGLAEETKLVARIAELEAKNASLER
jgi:hypothetical protein